MQVGRSILHFATYIIIEGWRFGHAPCKVKAAHSPGIRSALPLLAPDSSVLARSYVHLALSPTFFVRYHREGSYTHRYDQSLDCELNPS